MFFICVLIVYYLANHYSKIEEQDELFSEIHNVEKIILFTFAIFFFIIHHLHDFFVSVGICVFVMLIILI